MNNFTVAVGSALLTGDVVGEGPAVAFLHAGVADRRMWRPQLAGLHKSHRLIAYDRRGFGETTAVDEAFSHVGDLRAVLDRLHVASAALVGCSQGGRVAIDFALAYPDRVTKLVLLAPAVSGAPAPESFTPQIETLIEALDEAEDAHDVERINEIEAHMWLDGPGSPPGRVGGDLRELFLEMNGIALHMPDLEEEIEPPAAFERLAELSLPALVLWGDLDFPHVQERCRALVQKMPGARGVELPGAAHLANLEQPQVINDLLQSFLD